MDATVQDLECDHGLLFYSNFGNTKLFAKTKSKFSPLSSALSFALLQAYLYLFILKLTGCKLTITLQRVGEGCHHHCCHCFGLGLDYPIFCKTQVSNLGRILDSLLTIFICNFHRRNCESHKVF